jgi:hypothetical protein
MAIENQNTSTQRNKIIDFVEKLGRQQNVIRILTPSKK